MLIIWNVETVEKSQSRNDVQVEQLQTHGKLKRWQINKWNMGNRSGEQVEKLSSWNVKCTHVDSHIQISTHICIHIVHTCVHAPYLMHPHTYHPCVLLGRVRFFLHPEMGRCSNASLLDWNTKQKGQQICVAGCVCNNFKVVYLKHISKQRHTLSFMI